MMQFIYLGNMLIEKGPLVLIEACNLLHKRQVPFLCHLVGAETDEISLAHLERLVTENNLTSEVYLHGALYGHDKEQLLRQSDVMVFPTFYHNECFPLVLLEGMKHSLPLLSTHEGAIPDIITEGISGMMVERRNAHALAKAMQTLIETPEKAKIMGKNAHMRYLEHFSKNAFLERLSGILRES